MTARAPFAAALAGCLVLAGCGADDLPEARADVPQTPTIAAEAATVEEPVSIRAQLFVERDAVVAARSAGPLERLRADVGARVQAGQLLAQIESGAQELALAQAEAALDNAERLARRARALAEANGVTAADLEEAEYRYRQAELAVRHARRELELTRVVAPFAGVVSARAARLGQLVGRGDTLFRITEMAPLRVRVRLPEDMAMDVRPGATAVVVGGDGDTAVARVERVAPVFDAGSGTREVVARLAAGARFLPGATVEVRLGQRRRHVVAVPREALASDGQVLVVENGRATMRVVQVGDDIGRGRVEIVSGLVAGERLARPQ